MHCDSFQAIFAYYIQLAGGTKTINSCNASKTHRHSAYLAFKLAGQTRIPVLKIFNIPPGRLFVARADGPFYSPLFEILTAALRIPSVPASRFHWSADLPAAPYREEGQREMRS